MPLAQPSGVLPVSYWASDFSVLYGRGAFYYGGRAL